MLESNEIVVRTKKATYAAYGASRSYPDAHVGPVILDILPYVATCAGQWADCIADGMRSITMDPTYVKGAHRHSLISEKATVSHHPIHVTNTMQSSLEHKFPYTGWWRLGVGLAFVDLKAEAKRVFQTALTLEPQYAHRHPFR